MAKRDMVEPDGPAIKAARVDRGLEPGELAERVGCSYSHLNNIEAGRKRATPELLIRIARELGTSVDQITTKEAA